MARQSAVVALSVTGAVVLVALVVGLSLGLTVNKGNSDPEGRFAFASYYGSHMVLQRAPARAAIWGYAENVGDYVSVTLDSTTEYSPTAIRGPEGLPVWSVMLDPQPEGGPHSIRATSGDYTLQLEDVLFGDVYVCSGQSNMVHRLDRTFDPEVDVNDAVNYPDVRGFQASLNTSEVPQYDLPGVDFTWQRPTNGNMAAFSAVCWLFGTKLNSRLGRPIGLVQAAWGGTRIETWMSPEALDVCFPDGAEPGSDPQNEASRLWNAMIHPLLNITIYGVAWYQGEYNQWNAEYYACALKAMIADWRMRWSDQTDTDKVFPFGQVQLAPFMINDDDFGFSKVRWAQTYNLGYTPNEELPNVFTAIALDLPDLDSPWNPIHPRHKRQIAGRLALGALRVAYDVQEVGPYQGPFPTSLSRAGEELTIVFDNGTASLDIRDTGGYVAYEVCCANSTDMRCPVDTVWTEAKILGTPPPSAVIVAVNCTLPGFEHVTGLRYAWRETPCLLEACAIYRVTNDLPAPPYLFEGLIPNVSPAMEPAA